MARITATPGRPGTAKGRVGAHAQATRAGAGRTRHTGLAVFAGCIALSAYGGGLGLIIGFLTLGDVVTPRLPFASPVLAGIALLAVVAIPNTVVAWLAARGDRRVGDASVLAGFLLAGWIVVELAFIRQFSFFHPLFLVVGGLLIWVGLRARPHGEPASDRR